MAEPEDLIIDGALVATRVARRVWRRHVPSTAVGTLSLAAVRQRVELFLQALFAMAIPVAQAEAAAPQSWLARLAGRAPDAPCAPLAGNDAVRIYLPGELAARNGFDAAFQQYLLLAIGQAVRVVRGSSAALLQIRSAESRDRFQIAEAVAVDAWTVREAPGLVPALRAVRLDALARRGRVRPGDTRECAAEALVRELLASDPAVAWSGVPTCATASAVVAWAHEGPASQQDIVYRGITSPWYWGAPQLFTEMPAASAYPAANTSDQPGTRPRVSEMRRRPRARLAQDDEDDPGSGTWIIRTDEPQQSVEDPFGLQRPADHADEADVGALADSLAELPEARVVRTPGRSREILRAGDETRRAETQVLSSPVGAGIAYPEWDFRSGTYRRPGAVVREVAPALGDSSWVASALARHATLVRRVRSRFEGLRPGRTRVGRQSDGAEVDVAEYVTASADARAGTISEDRLYVEVRPGRRELRVALLVDISASTDSWVAAGERIVDVEKHALLVVCEALQALGNPYAVFAFSGESAHDVAIVPVKGFAERSVEVVRRRIAALDADGYTRAGAAIRHATAALGRQPAERRLLLLLSDGKPNDVDIYAGPYGIEDSRQAVAEARAQGIHVFCLTVDRDAPRYAPRIFGAAGFAVLRRPDHLVGVLVDVLRRLIRR